jgi:hypothetical protein
MSARARPAARVGIVAVLALGVAANAGALVWHVPHCRAFAPHQHYVVPGAAMCERGGMAGETFR